MNKTQARANNLYAHMLEISEETVSSGKKINVWRGFIGKTCRNLGIAKGTESRILGPLTKMGCIEVIDRGAAKYPSVIALIKPPTEEMWLEFLQTDDENRLTRPLTLAKIVERVENVERLMGGANLGEALLNLDRRLTALESQNADKS